ncbi:hypothetical protein RF11_00490 [Thelohanellus kitauei]|uniref:Uncharacterized protein n=1 Tax=Thelohanellus kitauei TaxID=669202 RepID=A0A0C2MWR4_THEKT|nr:hypothetical protein RF11_00490 [Thelohanellus kitauei]
MSKLQIDEYCIKILNLLNDIRILKQQLEHHEEEYDRYEHSMFSVTEVINDATEQISILEKAIEHQDINSAWSQNALAQIESYKNDINVQELNKVSILRSYNEKKQKITALKEQILGKEDEIASLKASLDKAGVSY